MPSPEASRRNSRRSSGPRTPEGKAASRLNGLSHGAFAGDLLLPGENAEAFRELEENFHRHYHPANEEEWFFVNRMILAAWRLQRLAAMESRVLRNKAGTLAAGVSLVEAIRDSLSDSDESSPSGSEAGPCHDPIASAWIQDSLTGNTLVKIGRSQTALERSFYRALRALHQLRSGLTPPPEKHP
ncbi:MAG TPA: hypothetical protein VLH09_13975 [Bryobacteraceae bacterium]|nr:hypothetical protein [Bryobacteraceae bacterium]